MKAKIPALLLMVIILFSFFSCGESGTAPGKDSTAPTGSEKVQASEKIRSIVPNGSIYVRPGEKVNVIITGSSDCEYSVKCGIKTFEAKDMGIRSGQFSVFEAQVSLPDSEIEIESIGMMTIIGRKGENSFSVDGPRPKLDPNQGETENSGKKQAEESTTLKGDNQRPDDVTTQQSSTGVAPEPPAPVTEKSGAYPPITPVPEIQDGTLAVITGKLAESFPTYSREKRFNPSYSQWLPGTSVIVTDTYTSDDSDGGTYEYAVTSNGSKVLKEDLTFTGGALPDTNALTFIGSGMTDAGLTLRFRQETKTPFNFSLGGQSYTRSDGKNFPVSAFTANSINFCFYHTTGFSGDISAAGSEIVGAPSVSEDAGKKTVTLTFPLKTPGTFCGYKAAYNQSGELEITIRNRKKGIAGAVIMLDPGHGGEDPGALGYGDQIKECDVNLSVTAYLKTELEKMGATVYSTRYNDSHVSLDYRREFALSVCPDIFVSIHSNAAENPDSFGTSVFYYHAMSFPLAYSIYNRMLSAYYTDVYPDDSTRANESGIGVMYYPFAVTRGTQCPSVLVEVGYLTNDREALRLADENVRKAFAAAIANGIKDALEQ